MPVRCSAQDYCPRDTQGMASIHAKLRAALVQVGDSGPQFGDPCIKEYTNMEYVVFLLLLIPSWELLQCKVQKRQYSKDQENSDKFSRGYYQIAIFMYLINH